MVVNRIRKVTEIKAERTIKVWDSVTQGQLQGQDGFHYCLRLTLYRPRDVLLLLNEAFRYASHSGRPTIEPVDLDSSAKSISDNRLADLIKEYSAELPGLRELISGFAGKLPVSTVEAASDLVGDVVSRDIYSPAIQQQFALFADRTEALRSLYSVGFIGLREEASSNYVYCHDGRKPDKGFSNIAKLMVHPCYWMALNLTNKDLDEKDAAEIYDEYDISVKSETPEQRSKVIGQLESELRAIEVGLDGAAEFEAWCLKVLRVLFAAGLRNIESSPNRASLQRRDVVGTNHGETAFWKRILEEYQSRQVLFEVKNFKELERQHFWQINSYICQEYGNFGCFITRADDISLSKDRELAWIRELKNQHSKVVMVLTANYLSGLLNKLRSPAKHDQADDGMDKLLDRADSVFKCNTPTV